MNILNYQESFLEKLKLQGKTFNTVKNYKADLNCFNHFLLEKKKKIQLPEFSSIEVKEYEEYLNQKYNSSNSIRRRVQALRIFFDYLIEKNLYPDNPIKKIATSPKQVFPPKPIAFYEVRKTYELLKLKVKEAKSPFEELLAKRNVVVFGLIYGCGLKVSDLAQLERSQILIDGNQCRVMITHPKRDPFSILAPDFFIKDYQNYLVNYLEHLEKNQLNYQQVLFSANPHGILFGGLSPRGTELFFQEFKDKYKIPINAKNLRQACIFKWLSYAVTDSTIKEWMGVTPQYDLSIYKNLQSDSPESFTYLEVTHNGDSL